jgi:hypothetical protein
MSFDEQPDGDIHGECAHEIHSLQQQLAAEQAYSAKLRIVLSAAIAAIDYKRQHLNDVGPDVHSARFDSAFEKIQDALALPHDDSALREWGARLLRKLAKDVPYIDSGDLFVKADELVSGDWKP